ncbi:hypothetical protein F511_34548 [Dorcoceras hygrometricum]|uniref:Uncharacterized protein n=1 Tax=Dorcoceras hygrometricum TaxID=472368 RepID=A0A2Z7C6P8_9LAMI|nr:hypothetical protein F511_34548 [Dorcoceras hygrometricum]
MAPSVPRTRAAAALRMKQISLDNQSHMIRRLRAKQATEKRESTAIKKEHESTLYRTPVSVLSTFMKWPPSVPRTRAAAALRMKQISLDNQSHMIRRLRAKQATEKRESTAIKKEHESTQVALEASHMTIDGLTEIGLCMSKKIERMKAKKQQTRERIRSAIISGKLVSKRPKIRSKNNT